MIAPSSYVVVYTIYSLYSYLSIGVISASLLSLNAGVVSFIPWSVGQSVVSHE